MVILNLIYFLALSASICTPAVQKDLNPFFWSSAINNNMDFSVFQRAKMKKNTSSVRVSAY